jgi:hypothetical protein
MDSLDPVVVRRYQGRDEKAALAEFEADSPAMTQQGYVVVAQDWSEGLPNMFQAMIFGFRGPLPRVLTVTYQLP